MNYEEIIYTAALNKLNEHGFSNARILALCMVAQSKHESANYTSHIFLTANNAFGYSYYKGSIYQVGKGPVADNGLASAKYKTIADSAREIADWIHRRQQTFKKVTNVDQYADGLKYWGYFGDKRENYLAGLHSYWKTDIKTLTDNLNNNGNA